MHYDAQKESVVERIGEAAMSLLPFARRKVQMQIDGGVEAEKSDMLLESMSIYVLYLVSLAPGWLVACTPWRSLRRVWGCFRALLTYQALESRAPASSYTYDSPASPTTSVLDTFHLVLRLRWHSADLLSYPASPFPPSATANVPNSV